jgi:hypothetical protein
VFSAAIALMFSAPVTDTFAADTPLLEPHNLIVDRSLDREQADAQIIAARRYDTFWNTGDEALARAALTPNFIDNTLPTGRPQGVAGPLAASKLNPPVPEVTVLIRKVTTNHRAGEYELHIKKILGFKHWDKRRRLPKT